MKVADTPSLIPPKVDSTDRPKAQPPMAGLVSNHRRSDTVTLSKKAEAIAAAAKRIKAMPDVDMNRVVRVKAMLQNGTYQVDAEKVASNMLRESMATRKPGG